MAPRGALTQISLWNKPPGQPGAVCVDTFPPARDRRHWEAIDNDEGCSFTIPLGASILPKLVERQIIVYEYDPVGGPGSGLAAEYDVFRFTELDKVHGPNGSRMLVSGRSLFWDLDAAGLVYLESGGQKFYEFTDTRTPTQWLSTYILPALARRGYSHITLGTVDPTDNITIAVAHQNAMELMQELIKRTSAEAQVRRSGTQHLLDLVSAINGSLVARALAAGRSLPSLRVRSSAIPMATMVVPVGTAAHDATSKTIQRLPWKITAVDAGNLDVTVEPLDGGAAKLIRWDGQYSTVSGLPYNWFVVCRRSGREFAITNSYPLTQKLRLGGGLGSLAIGDELELREGVAVPTRFRVEEFASGNLRYPRRISGVAGSVLTLATLCSGDPVPTNDEHLDEVCEISQFIVATTASAAADNGNGTSRITVTSTASMLAGDWGFLSSAGAEPWGAVKFWEIVTVVSGTQIDVRYKHLGFTGVPYTTLGGLTTCRVYRKRAVAPYVSDEVASTDAVTVSDATSIATNDIIEFYRNIVTDLAGAIPCGTNLGQYGMVERKHTRDDLRSEVNIGHASNCRFSTWTGSAVVPPDGYTGGPVTRLTTGLIGPATTYNISCSQQVFGPVVRPPLWTLSDLAVTVRFNVKVPPIANWTGDNVYLRLQLLSPSNLSLASAHLYPEDATFDPFPAGSVGSQVAGGSIVEVNLTVALTHASAGHPLYLGLKPYLIEQCTAPFQWGGWDLLQTQTAPGAGYYTETSEGYALHTASILELDRYDVPDATYEATVLDSSRLNPEDAPIQLMKGVPVSLDDEAVSPGTLPTVRIVRIDWEDDQIGAPRVTIDRMPEDLSAQVVALVKRAGGGSSAAGASSSSASGSSGASGAPIGASYLTLGVDGTLTNERVLTAGANITLTDNGPGSTLVIAATGGGGGGLTYAEAFRLARIAKR